jgi:hypothetical protein
MTARGGTHPPRKVYDEGTVTYLPWKRNATLKNARIL